uniref:Uncharacterized protein n=1 Tax=Anguilla anguilla TaxID=7936 RepID=A0A0E9V296_ANGAN
MNFMVETTKQPGLQIIQGIHIFIACCFQSTYQR